jgi:hypothetical protein
MSIVNGDVHRRNRATSSSLRVSTAELGWIDQLRHLALHRLEHLTEAEINCVWLWWSSRGAGAQLEQEILLGDAFAVLALGTRVGIALDDISVLFRDLNTLAKAPTVPIREEAESERRT